MPNIKITVSGDEELARALRDARFVDGPIKEFIDRATLHIEGIAKEGAPVDTGRFRASIESRVGKREASVFSAVEYAPYIEHGTRPHWPPVAVLEPWARRHGIPSAFLVARAIARRGTKARRVFASTAEKGKRDIGRFADELARDIVQAFRRGVG